MSKSYQRRYRLALAPIDSRLSAAARVGAALCCCGLLLLVGCSSHVKLVPVQGKLTQTDGSPLPGGYIVFVPLDRDPNIPRLHPAEGLSGSEGDYTIFTNGQPGAPVGKYRVVLRAGMDRTIWSRVPSQYFSQENSPLEVEVVEEKPGHFSLMPTAKRGFLSVTLGRIER